MIVNDLRIGNWVLYIDLYCKIVGIDKDRVLVEYHNGDTDYCYIDYIEPIKLTEEVLVKIGFKKVCEKKIASFDVNQFILKNYINNNEFGNISYHLFKSGNSILFIEYGDYYKDKYNDNDNIYKLDVKYLHQLQNTYYCLTGQELNIEL